MKKKFILGNCYLNKAEMVLTHFTPVALTFDLKNNRVHLLPRMDVWTKFEEGSSRCSRVIDRKRKGYRRRD